MFVLFLCMMFIVVVEYENFCCFIYVNVVKFFLVKNKKNE